MKRDIALDILRAIALLCIILIHIRPDNIIVNQLRSFDVPMMVFLSGVSYSLSSSGGGKSNYFSYCIKRFKRLVLPTWIFLILYYTVLHIAYFIYSEKAHILWSDMFHNFTLMTGWYVWIIRVFLIISLFAPFIESFSHKFSKWLCIIIALSLLAVFELFALERDDSVIYYMVMTIPYISIFTIGLLARRGSKQFLLSISFIMLAIYSAYAIYYYNNSGCYLLTQIAKYPPKLYYTSYALGMVLLLYLLREKIHNLVIGLRLEKLFGFIGSHTIWIYFWHIPFLFVLSIFPNPIVRFFCVAFIAISATYLQVKFINLIISRIKNESLKKNLKILFLG